MNPWRAIRKKSAPLLGKLRRWEFWQRVPLRLAVRYVNPERPRRTPAIIRIEPTSKCNLRCPTCSYSREKDAGRHLTGEDLCNILDRLPSSPASVVLSGVGEPLLNPHFFTLVDILAGRGIRCVFFTNGTLLTPRIREAILSRFSIEEIRISCDGAQKATFERLRAGANFDGWKQLVRQFLAEAKQRRPTLSIGANVVLSNQNLRELGEIIHLAADLGFSNVSVMEPTPVDDLTASYCLSPAELSTVRQEDLWEMGRTLGLAISCGFRRAGSSPRSMVRCLLPWTYLFIRASGDVAPCYALFGPERATFMGNLLERDFAEIWQGERFRSFRRSSAAGTNALCRICPYY